MERVIKLIIVKSSLVLFAILLSVSAAPTGNKAVAVDTTDLKLFRLYNEQTLKKIDHEFQRAAQSKEY